MGCERANVKAGAAAILTMSSQWRRATSAPLAGDGMSVAQADATAQSLKSLQSHNDAMRVYAEDYIAKLMASRDSIVNAEQNNEAQMRSVDRRS